MRLLNLLLVIFVFTSCTNGQRMNDAADFSADDDTKAVATFISHADHDISGTVTFENTDEGVRVSGNIDGLESGAHGFHVHQYGDCSAADFSSAGGHYNPDDSPHASPEAEERHMGDMGNLEVTGSTASVDYVDDVLNINDILSRAVLIHAGEDDLESQPSGDSGSRIACGVIGIAQTEANTEQSNSDQTFDNGSNEEMVDTTDQ